MIRRGDRLRDLPCHSGNSMGSEPPHVRRLLLSERDRSVTM